MNTHKIILGDCIKVMKEMEANSVDLIVTSPPYNMRTRIRNGKYTTREKSDNFSKKYKYFEDALPIDNYYYVHKSALREMLRISPIVFWNVQIVTGSKEAIFKIIGDFHKELRDIIVWDKIVAQPAMHKSVLNRGYELILIFEQGAQAGRAFTKSCFKRGEMSDVWKIPKEKNHNIPGHRACFPEKIPRDILKGWSNRGDTVLDPFVGSGTTLLAAEDIGRNSIGIDISKEYCKLAYERLKKKTEQTKLTGEKSNITFI